jgi:2-polyprenyl-3-methyl-5-hydroxy-6-metoxy-1,4-benzoquinol methylase
VSASAYDEIAEWYDAWVGGNSMPEDDFFRATVSLMGDVRGLRICDLACGQGRAARPLADRGAHVVAIDVSEKMLDIARRHEAAEPRGIIYVQADAQRLDDGLGEPFDGVVCHMALMDISDLEATLHTISQILKPDGWFVFAVLHPCFNLARSGEQETSEGWIRTVAGYFAEGYWRSDTRTGPPGKVGAYHRTLSTYVNALTAAGLIVERILEPQLTGTYAERRPIWTEVPGALVVRCRAAGTVASVGGIA